MKNNMLRKGLVLAIIVLFIGAGVVPAISGNTVPSINEGPDESSDFTLELKWTRILVADSEVLLDVELGEYGPINAGYRHHVYLNLECFVSNSFFNIGINVYEVQITNTADDLNPDDNTASFKYIVIGF